MDRRDFINGVLVTVGGTLFSGCAHHLSSLTSSSSPESSQGAPGEINTDPRALRGGNLPTAFSVGHWMRDRRLKFLKNSVEVAALGSFPLHEDSTSVDVVILGSGLSGLSTAYSLRERFPSLKVLLLDANATPGGNAGYDNQSPLPHAAPTGAAYAVAPTSDELREVFRDIGLPWEKYIVPTPFYSYFFDEHTPFRTPGSPAQWVPDVYGAGLANVPYPREIVQDLLRAKKEFEKWYHLKGAPTDPSDLSDPKFDHLAGISLDHYLKQDLKMHPAVSDFYTRFTIDALAGTTSQVSAHTAISFLGAEYNPLFVLPGGNSGITKHFLRSLIPDSIPGKESEEWASSSVQAQALDQSNQKIRIRQNAVALRADTSSQNAEVIYHLQEGSKSQFYRVRAKAVVVATQSHSAQHLVGHLIDSSRQQAWRQIHQVPVPVANVVLREAAPLVELGLGFNQYWWGSKYWADFSVGDWMGPRRKDPRRQTVLTFYGGNTAPPEKMPYERVQLLTTPFASYEASLREDMERIFARTSFDFDRDVQGIYLYRWGHGMVYAKPGYPFAPPTQINSQWVRNSAPRHQIRKPLGRIFFAGQDLEGSPSLEAAVWSGFRAAREIEEARILSGMGTGVRS